MIGVKIVNKILSFIKVMVKKFIYYYFPEITLI